MQPAVNVLYLYIVGKSLEEISIVQMMKIDASSGPSSAILLNCIPKSHKASSNRATTLY